jgi:hypothetical protein
MSGSGVKLGEYDPLSLEISLFVYFMVQILFHRSNSVYTATLFKILTDVALYTLLDLQYLIWTMKLTLSILNIVDLTMTF